MKIVCALLLLIPNISWGFGKTPLEKCMDKVIDGTYGGNETMSATAAKYCAGADEGVLRCMDRVIDGTYGGNETMSATAAKYCTGN